LRVLEGRLSIRVALHFGVILIFALWFRAGFAEKMVNPDAVAPEFRAAAEKRRAEQIKLFACNKKADEAKVLRRDRATFIGQCLGE
jgi:hypothetical protein